VTRFARAGLWLLPVYCVLLALRTLTQQPDYRTDFRGYAEYVTTYRFLVSHLGASIAGAALALLAVLALLGFLVRGPAVTAAIVGTALTMVGNVGNIALFGVAAFAQPAISRACLNGAQGVPELNDDVYGTPLFATAGFAILCFIAGAILLGLAIARVVPGGTGRVRASCAPVRASLERFLAVLGGVAENASWSPKPASLQRFPHEQAYAPGRIRTCDPRIRSPPLCPLSYRRPAPPYHSLHSAQSAVAVAQLVEPRVVVPVVVGSNPIRHP
jgi:hypothetical protein